MRLVDSIWHSPTQTLDGKIGCPHGKESNNLEETQIFGVLEKDYEIYLNCQNFIDKN